MLDGSPSVEAVVQTAQNSGQRKGNANLRPFQPGKSGNPGGRPKKEANIAALAQKHAEQAVLALAEIVANGAAPPSARVSAAAEILDRGFGRAPASLDVNHKMEISEAFEGFLRGLVGRRQAPAIEAEVTEIVSQPLAGINETVISE